MARIARVVIPDHPHHIVQRGNRRQEVFFSDNDRAAYLEFLKNNCESSGINIWAYCLMDNHIHLIVVPQQPESFAKGIGDTHQQYTRMINFREDWRGYLWQGRFKSCVMDDRHTISAIRYVENNPVRAKIVRRAEDYQWSSAYCHVHGIKNDILSTPQELMDDVGDWKEFLGTTEDEKIEKRIKSCAKTGRPLGDVAFARYLEKLTGRDLIKQKPGRKAWNAHLY